jgi:hypothetical protein
MGIGPSIAIPKVLSQVGISKEDVDLFEVIRSNYSDGVRVDRKGTKTD